MQSYVKRMKDWFDEKPRRKVYTALILAVLGTYYVVNRIERERYIDYLFEAQDRINNSKQEQIHNYEKSKNYSLPVLNSKPVVFEHIENISKDDFLTFDYIKNAIGSYTKDSYSGGIKAAGRIDIDKDGRKELIAVVREKDRKLRTYAIKETGDPAVKLIGENWEELSDPDSLEALDSNNDGKPEVMFRAHAFFNDYVHEYFVLQSYDPKLSNHICGYGKMKIADFNGNGIPEFITPEGHITEEWNGEYYTVVHKMENQLKDIRDAMAYAIAADDENEKSFVMNQINSLYSDDLKSFCKNMILYDYGLRRVISLYPQIESLEKMDLKEFAALSAVKIMAQTNHELNKYMKERKLIREYGGDTDMHYLVRGADGHIEGLRVRTDYNPDPDREKRTVRYNDGTGTVTETYSSEKDAYNRRLQINMQQGSQRLQQDLNRAREYGTQQLQRGIDAGRQTIQNATKDVGRSLQNFFKKK